MALFAALLVRLWHGRSYYSEDLGLVRRRSGYPYVLGVIGGIAYVVVVYLATRFIPWKGGAGVAGQGIVLGDGWAGDVLAIVTMAIAVPLGHELVYRALVFRGIYDEVIGSRRPGRLKSSAFAVAAVASAVVYALSCCAGDFRSGRVVLLALWGLIASFLYWRTGSLYPAALGLSVANVIQLVLDNDLGGKLSSPVLWLLVIGAPAICLGLLSLIQNALSRQGENTGAARSSRRRGWSSWRGRTSRRNGRRPRRNRRVGLLG